ncbi:peptide transporter MTD1 [Chytriomyces sp. MP71]|nr:peptide transporter MTD1 [Chytriomyces sp. MP71]
MKKTVDSWGFEMASKIVSTEDDPNLPVFTFRFWIITVLLSVFAGTLGQIYLFKPQTIAVSTLFILLLSYFMGLFMARVLPSGILNPGPFNVKEHVLIVVSSSTAAGSALATNILAVLNLYYDQPLGIFHGVTLVIASQLLGYGICGFFRNLLVYPKRAYYPSTLSSVTLFESLHRKGEMTKNLQNFYWTFAVGVFFWTWFPQWMAPTLIGISFFCIANRNSDVFTKVFGGVANNEGLGLFSISFDWVYIGSTGLTLPWSTQINSFVGLLGCVIVVPYIYYNNVWNAKNVTYMSQNLFLKNGTSYNQKKILDADFTLNLTKYQAYGQPYYAGAWAFNTMGYALGISATLVHVLLWHGKEMWAMIKTIRFNNRGTDAHSHKVDPNDAEYDVHYAMMQAYPEVPLWWYLALLVVCIGYSLYFVIAVPTQLPWWGLLIAMVMAVFLVVLTGFMYAVTGFRFPTTIVVQVVGGFMLPGRPIANMYFTMFGANTVSQSLALLYDLKIGQYLKVPPRAVFIGQVVGCVIGAVVHYGMNEAIIQNNRAVLLDNNGDAQWSGQNVQSFNTKSVTWGALGAQLFGPGMTYQWVTYSFGLGLLFPLPFYFLHRTFPKIGFNMVNTGIISWYLGNLTVGINSSIFTRIVLAFIFQYYLRKYRSEWFNRYNYLLAAALDSGANIAVFFVTMTVGGALGKRVQFPYWFLNPNPADGVFPDYCTNGLKK